ncbi:MAG: EAL domain-containing protein [Clostridia bacterium]|nr:EAL domain-containing protein [Clostridia bacterium]
MGTKRGSDETSIYVIDRDYRLVYFNGTLKGRFKDVRCGDFCYEKLCGEDRPCQGCPLNQDTDGAVMFYNKAIRQWVEVDSGDMDWPGLGPCRVILVREINESNKNLFYNLTSISAYDELFELNFTRDYYKILYHQEGKYVIPAPEGTLSSMVRDVSEHMIHPGDAKRFLEFWEPERITSSLLNPNDSHVLKGEFRKRKVDNTWCWVAQIVVPILKGAGDEDIVMCFIQDIDEQKRREESLTLGNKEAEEGTDPITGLCRRPVFFRQSDAFLKQAENPEDYCLMAIDIEHFKLFNDWYGQEAGDRLLATIGNLLKKTQEKEGGLAGYMGGDDFVILLPDAPAVLRKLQEEITRYMKEQGGTAGFLPAFGIYGIGGGALQVSNMYDLAVIALSSVKGNYAQRVSRYDIRMKQKLEEDHRLLSEIQRALEHGEITFYAQPKCNMRTGRIVGLESLVRWNHPERGLISPGAFIPLLESNGLVTKLDLYVWEEVCKRVKKWIDSGHRAVPISVNVSRMDIYTLNVPQVFQELINRYSLDPRLIEIEITESAYVEEYKVITAVVEELRSAGFTVLMDDFGSGYSSLNMLKDVNVDVLKIDMKFLDMDHESMGKSMGILEAITRMANIVGIRMIAEGVENKEQMELLLDMGCTYGQGYYFYHPMPIEVFEPILSDEANIDFRGIKARQIERIRLQDLLNGDMVSDAIMNNILGAVAFYDLYDGRLELLSVNEQYCSVTGTTAVDLEEVRKTILDTILEEDQDQVMDIFSRARENPIKGAEGDMRIRRGDGTPMWMHLRVFFLREQDGHWLYYGAVSGISRQQRNM